eukprot:TRINITY_DN6839_c0_g2_i1.p3 TRINITY_DN6839_c0_g2~~TRINITY_DN6839_c0_g2_i1.p3  ORF type:complete len:272 (+),score=108.01 TRINITY_DN6839_c0_g2_i1:228-1043(+)
MAWGAAGGTLQLPGASGRQWALTFVRTLGAARGPVSVHVVDAAPAGGAGGDAPRQLVAKRVVVPAVDDVEPLVDEAATWRKASVASSTVLELVDVFVDRTPAAPSITFLSVLATPRKAGKSSKKAAAAAPPALPAAAVAAVGRDVAAALGAMPGGAPHGNVAVDTVFLVGGGPKNTDATGAVLGGFGPTRVAVAAANPGLTEADDVYDLGVLLAALATGRAPAVAAAAVAGGELPDDLPPELASALARAVGPATGRPSLAQLREAAGGGSG